MSPCAFSPGSPSPWRCPSRNLTGATAPIASPFHSGLNVLPAAAGEISLVEDSATDAALTVRAFKRANLTNRIRIVSDGEDGLHYLRGTGLYAQQPPATPQLILLDLNLPGIARRSRATRRSATVRRILRSAAHPRAPMRWASGDRFPPRCLGYAEVSVADVTEEART